MEHLIFDADTLAMSIDANKIAFGTLLSTLPHAILHDEPGILWFESGVHEAIFNGVLQTRLAAEELPATIERVQEHFQQRRLPFQWHIGPSSQPANFGDLLIARGIFHDEDEPGMAVDLLSLNEDLPVASNIVFHPVLDDVLLHQWTRTWGCRAPAEVIQRWLAVYSGLPHDPQSPLHLYLGAIDGKPVATVALFCAAGVASIEHVVTLPEVRGQGIGAATTLMAAREARALGYRTAVLTASPMGINIYRRIGFRDCCTFSTYAWEP